MAGGAAHRIPVDTSGVSQTFVREGVPRRLPARPRVRFRRSDAIAVLALALVYVIAARLGLAMDAVGGFATLVWPPAGLSLAAVTVLGYRAWPGVFVGA